MIGRDGRMDAPGKGRQLFIGGAPDSPDSKLLPIGGPEEVEIIALLEQWVDQTQGFIRREALMEADSATLKGQDLLDRLALEFVLDLRRRDVS